MQRGESSHTGKHGKDVVLDVDSMVYFMAEKLASTRGNKSSYASTIFKVPEDVRNDDAAAYSPKVVSIGLLPQQKRRQLDEHKWHYLDKVLSRSNKELEMYTKEMVNIVHEAVSCYSGSPGPDDIRGAELGEYAINMLLDGSFIINLILQLKDGRMEINDPIYKDRWTLPSVVHDMLLLENQLPFFVLEKLWELTTGGESPTLKTTVLEFFCYLLPEEHDLKLPEKKDVHHLLHLMHLFHQPTAPAMCYEETTTYLPPPPMTIPSVTELQEAGVKFRQRKKAKSFLDVTFKQGLMQLSRLTIFGFTNSLFRNFIAFEQEFPDCGSYFTSYCIFMDSLINTPRDVEILKHSGIIEHSLGSDEEVALLFNKLPKGIGWDYKHSYLADVYRNVEKHTQKEWPKWRARLVRDYFSNPWAILSLIAAIVILILTFLQTYFAVFAYFRPP